MNRNTVWRESLLADQCVYKVTMDHESRVVGIDHVGAGRVDFWFTIPYDSRQRDLCERNFTVVGTGDPFPEGARYVACTGRNTAGLVWHLLELPGGPL